MGVYTTYSTIRNLTVAFFNEYHNNFPVDLGRRQR